MSGHSKFSNIKRKKEKNDSARGKVFTKLGRELAIAVKAGGPDVNANSKLKDIVAKAKANNMSNDTIERSIKKAAGDVNAVNYERIQYEGYGPSGVAVIVDALTDNRNRAAANIRSAFTKNGGNMGTSGCVSFMFDEKGLILIEKDRKVTEDDLMMAALEAGAEDFSAEEEGYTVTTAPEDFSAVSGALEKAGIKMMSAETTFIPQTTANLADPEDRKKMARLLEMLDEEDDVMNVYHNWENENEDEE
ncbi:MAG: YebC/PmpR family DNA-binding transcriptional regulator [Defluviitaleaceae bacterium]|nr:YebC/PmpR family DNA-binding transcriptional regulator [Defluviitaleaceae bacterium]